ncbi:MAG: alkaline phosphatase PhoX [Caulobacter sp.]
MAFSRRSFLGAAATSLAFSGFSVRAQDEAVEAESYLNEVEGYGELIADPKGLLDLPQGFRYRVIAQAGETMNDGLLVPGKFDGMGCFAAGEDKVLLVRNHELSVSDIHDGPFGLSQRLIDRIDRKRVWDFQNGEVPLPGGTTTQLYNLKTGQTERQHMSLAGTIVNCAGGVTPWGSWLTCEETTLEAGLEVGKDHGYVFEIPSAHIGLVEPVALKGLGRFKHEAACIDPRTGVVYLTEDLADGLFYRFLPHDRRNLAAGGRLQALGLVDAQEGGDTRNQEEKSFPIKGWKAVRWIDLNGVDNPYDDLRRRGHRAGAAIFSRGEGVHFGAGEVYFTATAGGAAGSGQIFRYVPSPAEGQVGEKDQPGKLQLFVESQNDRVLDYADNLTVAPWGHLIICEDRYSDTLRNHLRGVTPSGKVYTLGRNVFAGNSEFAGACFSPDGTTLFVNVQSPGITLAISGPWATVKA